MDGAPPPDREKDDGDVDPSHDAVHGGEARAPRALARDRPQEEVANVDEPQDQRGGETWFPSPIDSPDGSCPERSGHKGYGGENDSDLRGGGCPAVIRHLSGDEISDA